MRTRVRKSAFLRATVMLCGMAVILIAGLFLFNSLRAHAEGDERTEIYGLYYESLGGNSYWRYIKRYTIGTIESGCEEIRPVHGDEAPSGITVYDDANSAALAIIDDATMGVCEETTISRELFSATERDGKYDISDTVDSYFSVQVDHAGLFCNYYEMNPETEEYESPCSDMSDIAYGLKADDPDVPANRSVYAFGLRDRTGFATRLDAEDNLVFHNVEFKYTAINPTVIEDLPNNQMYPVGETVSIGVTPSAEYHPDDETAIPLSFSGWTSGQVDASQGSFVMPDEDVEFYGYFYDSTHEYTVTPQGYDDDIPAECRDEAMTLPRYYPILRNLSDNGDTCRAYTFEGWSLPGEDPGSENYDPSFIFVDGDMQITPSFTPKAKYRVLYALTSDSIVTGQLPEISEPYYSGEDILLSELPTYSNYVLEGWYLDAGGTIPAEDNQITVPEIDEDAVVTVYGRWVENVGKLEGFTIDLEQLHICDDGCNGPFDWMDEPSFDITVGNESGVDIYGYKVQIELMAQGEEEEWFEIPASEFCPNVSLQEGNGAVGLVDGKCISDMDEFLEDGQELGFHHKMKITRDATLMYRMTVTLVEVTPEQNEHANYVLTDEAVYNANQTFMAYSPRDIPDTFASLSGGSHPKAFLPRLIATIVTIVLIIVCAIVVSRKRIRPAFRYAALGAIALLLTLSIATILFQPKTSYAAPLESAEQSMLD